MDRAELPAGMRFFEGNPRGRLIDLGELWRYRELFWTLAWRDLTVRYRQTVVGVAWAVLQPVVMMTIYLSLFGLLGRMPTSDEIPYALVVLTGFLPWQLFAHIVNHTTSSLIANQQLLAKVYFPRLIIPLCVTLPALVDFAIGLVLAVLAMLYFGVMPTWSVLFLPVFVALVVVAALGLGIWFAALNARYRDVGLLVPFLLQVGFFASPVIYLTGALIPPRWQLLYSLNPMAGAIEGIRYLLLGQTIVSAWAVLGGASVAVIILAGGLAYFRIIERSLVDRM